MLTKKTIVGAVLAALSLGANAAVFNFTGNIVNHNDVISTTFTIDQDATNVRVWTDSFMNGINFDPITALWNAATGNLIDQDDDNPFVNSSTQTTFDSGFLLPSLAAGTYVFTVATFANFAAGTNLSDGFIYDKDVPESMSTWCQPANGCGMGTYWSVWLDGVTTASNPDDPNSVPEPNSLALLGLGMAGFVLSRRKKQ